MQFHVFDNITTMSEGAAEWIANNINETLRRKQSFSLLLSGGNTPKGLYTTLSNERFKKLIDWNKVEIFFGDERHVPFTDEYNNGRMAYDLLLKPTGIPSSNVHYINTTVNGEESAAMYESTLRSYFSDNTHSFDLAMLGIGDDGHTLSLFPGEKEMFEQNKWVVASTSPLPPIDRISLTPVIVNRSACIIFLVAGTNKASILDKVIRSAYDPNKYPVQIIKNYPYNVHLFADRGAVEQLLTNTA